MKRMNHPVYCRLYSGKTRHTDLMKKLSIPIFLFIVFTFSSSGFLLGQTSDTINNQVPGPSPQDDSLTEARLEPTAITDAFVLSNSLLLDAGKKHFDEEAIGRYREEVDTLFSSIDHFLGDSSIIAKNGVSLRELDVITQQAVFYQGEMSSLQQRLSGAADRLNESILQLKANKNDWESILEQPDDEEIPNERIARIRSTIHRLDSVNMLLQEDLQKILRQEDRITDKISAIEQLQAWVEDEREMIGERFLKRELPALYESKIGASESGLIKKHLDQIKKSFRTDLEIARVKYGRKIFWITIFLLSSIVLAFWFRKNYLSVISDRFRLTKLQEALIHSPLVTALFVSGLLIRLSMPGLPHTFAALNLMVMMIPMLIIIIRYFGKKIRTWIILLSILCGLTYFYQLSYNPDILLRWILLGFSFSGLGLFIWLIVKKPVAEQLGRNLLYKLLRVMLVVFILLQIVAVFANILGAFSLAEFFTIITIQIVLLAFGVEVATGIADTLVFLLLASNSMQKFNLIRDQINYILKKTSNLVRLLLWGLFFTITLEIFRVKDAFFSWGNGLFTNGIKIGEVEISLGSVAIFIFVIWLSIVLTRIIRHILEKDVFPRVETRKGIPSTVILLLKIVLISSGFFLAAAAAGIKLSNLSIVLGAFSVGIGFGLQNIFNNMVSGLILALERPIKVGDVVQVGELLGSVRTIGLRSSNVKSFDGAEVIVPNGNLISKEMINWTLSDSNRRMDIRVGVAYGSDTDEVLRILEELAREHPHVNQDHPPKAYFTSFGDSALEFRLLAWTTIDERLSVESDLNGAINKALKKASIEIPFPQRDIHIRSDQ